MKETEPMFTVDPILTTETNIVYHIEMPDGNKFLYSFGLMMPKPENKITTQAEYEAV